MNIFIRFIGFTYEVLLSRYLGAEAMGLFEIAVSTLMIFLILINSGTSTSVTKLVAEQRAKHNYLNIKGIFNTNLILNISLSLFLGLGVAFFAEDIAVQFLKNKDMTIGVYLLVPAIILISMTSVFRSYFYGLKNIVIPSIGEIIEGSAKVIVVMTILYFIYPVEPKYGALLAIMGISIGEFFNLLWYLYTKRKYSIRSNTNIDKKQSFLLKIITMSLPLTISGFINALLRFFNTILIPNKLMLAGYTNSEAVSTIGRVMGMTMPLIHLPFIVTNALVVNLIPSLTEQVVLKKYRDIKSDIQLSIKVTLLMSIPLCAIYLLLSNSLAIFLYSDPIVAKYIRIMGLSTILIALQHNISGILYGLNKQVEATITRVFGMIIQVILIFALVGNPKYGINGIFIAYYSSMLVVMVIDLITLRSEVRLKLNYWDILGKPIIASVFMVAFIYFTNYDLGALQHTNALVFGSSIIVGALAYIFVLILTKAVPKNFFKKFLSK
jgi:stage V sporulation protein B